MSMLEHFFSLNGDKSIFDGLEISKETTLCKEYMGKYPVISISLKGIDALNFETAFERAVLLMRRAASKVYYLLDSDALNEQDKANYRKLLDGNMTEAIFGTA